MGKLLFGEDVVNANTVAAIYNVHTKNKTIYIKINIL